MDCKLLTSMLLSNTSGQINSKSISLSCVSSSFVIELHLDTELTDSEHKSDTSIVLSGIEIKSSFETSCIFEVFFF